MSNTQEDKQALGKSEKICQSSKSTSKFKNVGDYIWSKLTSSRKNSSSLNITKTTSESKILSSTSNPNLIQETDTTPAKNYKRRITLFNLFDSSSKTKTKKPDSVKKSSNAKTIKKKEHQISISLPTPVKSTNENQVEDLIEPEIESIKINLMDNSMLKSKIHAASRRNNRNRPVTSMPSNPVLNTSMKSISSKISSQSLSTKMDAISEDPIGTQKAHDQSIENLNETKSSILQTIILKNNSSDSFSCKQVNTNRSVSSIGTSNESEQMLNCSIQSEKKPIETKTVESRSTSTSISSSSSSPNQNLILENINENKNKLNLESKENQPKIAIYDNNLSNSNFDKNEFFRTQPNNRSGMSKSNERLDKLKFKTTVYSSKKPNLSFVNRFSYIDRISPSDERKDSSEDSKSESQDKSLTNTGSNSKQLNYSKSLKIVPKNNRESKSNVIRLEKFSFDTPAPSSNVSKLSTSSNKLFNVKTADKESSNTNSNGEPVWKQLAFKKQNAWSQWNLQQIDQSNGSNIDKSNHEADQSLQSNHSIESNESKVKSIIRDLHCKKN